jgi:hypothetical protein
MPAAGDLALLRAASQSSADLVRLRHVRSMRVSAAGNHCGAMTGRCPLVFGDLGIFFYTPAD